MMPSDVAQAGFDVGVDQTQPVSAIDTRAFVEQDVAALAARYAAARPGPHIAIDGLFPPQVLDQVCAEIATIEVDPEKNFYSTYLKRRISDLNRLPPATRQLVSDLNSANFIAFLEKLTGIEGLVPDPHLEGGGLHQIGAGGYLKIHTDFNFHQRLKLHRRLNLLLYLNRDWQAEWGGAIEFWDEHVRECQASYLPLFNRMVVFSTTDTSYHGHPDPLACPDTLTRNSIALYYYTAERPKSEVRFKRSTMTNYQPRPSEGFSQGRLHHRLNQLEIRYPFLRRIATWLRRLT
jgi:hypothetical protein